VQRKRCATPQGACFKRFKLCPILLPVCGQGNCQTLTVADTTLHKHIIAAETILPIASNQHNPTWIVVVELPQTKHMQHTTRVAKTHTTQPAQAVATNMPVTKSWHHARYCNCMSPVQTSQRALLPAPIHVEGCCCSVCMLKPSVCARVSRTANRRQIRSSLYTPAPKLCTLFMPQP
jgi:hypothetical protein